MDKTTPSRVTRVELFEDRAAVLRELTLPTEPGRYTLWLGPISPLARESTLAVDDSPAFIVEDLRVHRRLLHQAEADEAQAAALEEERARAALAAREAEDARSLAEEAGDRALRVLQVARAWTPHTLLSAEDPAPWVSQVRAMSEAALAARLQEVELRQAAYAQRQEAEWATRRLSAARQGKSRWEATVQVQVLVREPAVLKLRYTIPCAVWRPVHRAELGGDTLRWELGAMAWNASGEDWSGVTLVCSTARPGDNPSPPQLTEDTLSSQRRAKEVVVEAREEEIHVAREGGAKVSNEALGVDDGGEARSFTALQPVDLPSNGRPVHVTLDRWSSPARRSWLGLPERSGAVVLRSNQHNAGTRPILAGPVVLVRDSGVVGRGKVGFVPPGEPFALGWGNHDGVRLSRRQDQKVDTTLITGKQTHDFTVTLRATNLSDEAVSVELRERIPVSELKELKVQPPKATPALSAGPDDDGFCTWRLSLEPRSTQTLELSYQVIAASNIQLPW